MSYNVVDPIMRQESSSVSHKEVIDTKFGSARSDAWTSTNGSAKSYFVKDQMDNGFNPSSCFAGATPYTIYYTLNPRTLVHTLQGIYMKIWVTNSSGGAITTLPAQFWLSRFLHQPQGTVATNELYPIEAYVKDNLSSNPRQAFYDGLTTYTDNDPSAAASTFAMFTSSTSVANAATSTFWYRVPDPYSEARIPLAFIDENNAPKLQFEISTTFQNTGGDFTCTAIDIYLFGTRYTPAVLSGLRAVYSVYPLVLRTMLIKRNYVNINWTAATASSIFNIENIDGKSAFLMFYSLPTPLTDINQITDGAGGLQQFTSLSFQTADREYYCQKDIPEDILQRVWPRTIPSPGFFYGSRRFYILPFTQNLTETLGFHLDRGSCQISDNCTIQITPTATLANCRLYMVNFCYGALILKGGVFDLVG